MYGSIICEATMCTLKFLEFLETCFSTGTLGTLVLTEPHLVNGLNKHPALAGQRCDCPPESDHINWLDAPAQSAIHRFEELHIATPLLPDLAAEQHSEGQHRGRLWCALQLWVMVPQLCARTAFIGRAKQVFLKWKLPEDNRLKIIKAIWQARTSGISRCNLFVPHRTHGGAAEKEMPHLIIAGDPCQE